MRRSIWVNPTCQRQDELRHFCNQLSAHPNNPAVFYKNDRGSSVYLTQCQTVPVVVKHLKTKSVWQAFRRCFYRSRTKKNRDFSKQCHHSGILTFDVWATVEFKTCGVVTDSFIIMSQLKGISLVDIFGLHGERFDLAPTAGKEVGLILSKLSKAGLSHRDMNFSNLLLCKEGIALVDLDGMRKQRWWHNWLLKSDSQRFIENWLEKEYASPQTLDFCITAIKQS